MKTEDRLLRQHILEVLHVLDPDLAREWGAQLSVPEIGLCLLVASLGHIAARGSQLQIRQRHGFPLVQPPVPLRIRLRLVVGGLGLGECDPVVPGVDAGEKLPPGDLVSFVDRKRDQRSRDPERQLGPVRSLGGAREGEAAATHPAHHHRADRPCDGGRLDLFVPAASRRREEGRKNGE